MIKHPTIKEMWDSFHKNIIPKNAHPIQVQETRRAFYAGAQGMMMINHKITNFSDDEGVEILEELTDELQQFMRDLLDGKA